MLTVWIVITIAAIVIEALTAGVVSLWFAVGGIAALIALELGASIPVQIGIFIVISLTVLFALRPFALKMLKGKEIKTNVDGLIGKNVLVTSAIKGEMSAGEVNISGQIWRALASTDEESYGTGEMVTVLEIKGVTAIVGRK